ncbi:MAG: tetratricopeptide repeat protein [Myxococcota bacterium]
MAFDKTGCGHYFGEALSEGDDGGDDTITSPHRPSIQRSRRRPPAATTDPGTELLGRYVLLDALGEGGGGQVFRAFDRQLERQVAIKRLKEKTPSRSHSSAIRLRREAQANALLQHPHVVSVFDVGEQDGDVFIAMEYVEGTSLKDWLKEPRSRREILQVFLQAGEGLFAAHEKGIIHRDFKPSNVLVGRDNRARVADFGLARAAGDTSTDGPSSTPAPTLVDQNLTRTGALVGTPAYMAPEQFLGGPVDQRSDQFAFCLALAEALTGTAAPRGQITNEGWATSPDALPNWIRRAKLAKPLRKALIRGLADEPDQRFATMRPILDAVRAASSGRRIAGPAAAIAAGTAALVAAGLRLYPGPCAATASALSEVWSPERRAQIQRRLEIASPAPWRSVWSSLDRYAQQWLEARTQICEATRVRGDQSESLMDIRMQCLDRRREGLRVFLGLLESGTIGNAARASNAVLRLGSPKLCTTVQSMRTLGRSLSPAEAERARELEALFAQLEAADAAGLVPSGLALAQRAVELADAIRRTDLQTSAHRWRAKLRAADDQRAQAVSDWERVSVLADASANDAVRLESYVELIRLDPGVPETAQVSDDHVERARAVLDRLGAGPRYKALVFGAMGALSLRRGDFLGCQTHGQVAMRMINEAEDAPLDERLELSEDLARCLERQGSRVRAAEVVRSSLELAERELGPEHPRIARLLVQLSRALDFSGNASDAESTARRSLRLAASSFGAQHSTTALAHQAVANVLFRKRDWEGALQHYRTALDIMSDVYGERSRTAGGLQSTIALTLDEMGHHSRAQSLHEAAIETLTKTVGPAHPETAAARTRYGWSLSRQGQCQAALQHHRKALADLRKSDPEHARMLDVIRGIVECLIKLGRPQDGVAYIEEGLQISEHRDEAPFYTAQLEYQAAQVFWSLGHRERSMTMARRAHRRLSGSDELRGEIEAWSSERF